MRHWLVLLASTVLVVLGAPSAHAGSTWPTVALNSQRTGHDTSEPSMLPVHNAWNATLDATVYAQPLVFGGRVFTATENDSVYALDAHDGRVLWKRHVGTPMTNVNAQVGCGNVDPLGILSTPVIDTSRHIIFVVATVQDFPPGHIHHQLIGLDTTTGIPVVSANADPFPNPLYNQQRTGLLLANGRVYIGYGGYAGDCGPYHGWLVSLSEAGTGKVAFDVTPSNPFGLGAIWAPGGVSADASGNVYAATGNPDPSGPDRGESVLKFDASAGMHLVKAFKTFPGGDDDLSSVSPAQLPNHLLFQVGKHRVGYLVDTTTMTALHTLGMCQGDADGADAWDGAHLYVPCNDGIRQVNVDVGNRNMGLGWRHPAAGAAGSPMLAAGSLWYVDWGTSQLVALNPATGLLRNGFPINLPSAVPHFTAPSAALGLILVGTDAGVSAYAGPSGAPPHAPNTCTPQKSHSGYWIASNDGNVYPFGAPNCGSLVGTPLRQPIVGIAGLATNGYWLVARDGGIFSFGTARYHGSMGGKPLARPIVGIARTHSGNGYWLVASDGGIFSFGDAKFHGSTGNIRLTLPIVGMAATPSGKGYWLVASDGGIFAFGDAKYHGSMGGRHLNRPIVGMAATPSGKGYWLVASDGGIFSFGDAKFHGSTGNIHLASPIVGMTASAAGYWFVAADGGVFAYDAPYHGSAAGLASGAPITDMAHD